MKKNNIFFEDRNISFASRIEPLKNRLIDAWADIGTYSKIMISWVSLFMIMFCIEGFSITDGYIVPVRIIVSAVTGCCGILIGIITWFLILAAMVIFITNSVYVLLIFLKPLGNEHSINKKVRSFHVRFLMIPGKFSIN